MTLKIYVASSWRNTYQPTVVAELRSAGHDVYDFKNPSPTSSGFSWKQCATKEQLISPDLFRAQVLTSPIAQAGFHSDMNALIGADVVVLVLPCGRSAHLELGYAVGAEKFTIVLFDKEIDEPELMYLMCNRLCISVEEVLKNIEEYWRMGNLQP